MRRKPVILIYDLDNALVDEISALVGQTGLYTCISTYNEANAIDVIKQYRRGFGLLTNRLSCIIIGWNHHKRMRDQLLFRLRAVERKSPLRTPTPVIVITEDHRDDLVWRALDPAQGGAAAYLERETFQPGLPDLLKRIVFQGAAKELNAQAQAEFQREQAVAEESG